MSAEDQAAERTREAIKAVLEHPENTYENILEELTDMVFEREAFIRADERAAWTKAIIGVAEQWTAEADKRSLGGYTPNDAIGLMHRAADLRALVEEARGGE